MIKFIHLRNVDLDNNILPYGGVTLAYEVSKEVITYSAAKCNVKDNFCKRIGRAKAEGRLKSLHHRVTLPFKLSYTKKDIVNAVVSDFSEEF